jgi:hypothetical protein
VQCGTLLSAFGAFFIEKNYKKTPLLAAEGFLIQVIQIRTRFLSLIQRSALFLLTSWGHLADLTGAMA